MLVFLSLTKQRLEEGSNDVSIGVSIGACNGVCIGVCSGRGEIEGLTTVSSKLGGNTIVSSKLGGGGCNRSGECKVFMSFTSILLVTSILSDTH